MQTYIIFFSELLKFSVWRMIFAVFFDAMMEKHTLRDPKNCSIVCLLTVFSRLQN